MNRLELKDKVKIITSIQSYLERNEESRFIHRLHGILLFAAKEDESCDSIGALFGNSPRTVSNWIKRVNETGSIDSLRSKPQPGRRPRLNNEQKEELRLILQESPEIHGIPANIWDGKSLSAYIEEHYGIALAVRTCQNLFHELGFALRRVRPVVARANEAKKAESKKTSGKNS